MGVRAWRWGLEREGGGGVEEGGRRRGRAGMGMGREGRRGKEKEKKNEWNGCIGVPSNFERVHIIAELD